METDRITASVIGAAIAVHSALGPGLLESTYEMCLSAELEARRLSFKRQHALPVKYRNLHIDSGYRVDFMIEGRVIVELKAIAALDRVHIAQLLTYLKLSGCRVGLLINFNVAMLKQGIRRLVL